MGNWVDKKKWSICESWEGKINVYTILKPQMIIKETNNTERIFNRLKLNGPEINWWE